MPILKYISRKRDKANFTLDIKYKDFQIFGEFVENYLINLRGDDYKRIIQPSFDTNRYISELLKIVSVCYYKK